MKKSITQKSERIDNDNQSITREFVRSLSAEEVQKVVGGGCPGSGQGGGTGGGNRDGSGGGNGWR